MGRTVLDAIVKAAKPKKKKVFTKKRVMTGLNIAAQILSVAVIKKPSLLPVQQALSMLTQEVPESEELDAGFESRAMRRIKELHRELSLLPPEQRQPVERELASLISLLSA